MRERLVWCVLLAVVVMAACVSSSETPDVSLTLPDAGGLPDATGSDASTAVPDAGPADTGSVLPDVTLTDTSSPPSEAGDDAALDAGVDGAPRWIHASTGDGGNNNATFSVAAGGADGGIIAATGALRGTIDFGSGPTASPQSAVFAAAFSNAGTPLWSVPLLTHQHIAGGVAVDPAGGVFVTDRYSGNVDLGGGTLPVFASGGFFVLKLDAGGQHVWSRGFGTGAANDIARGIAVTPTGNVVVVGQLGNGSIDFGTGTKNGLGANDIFVVCLNGTNGNAIWANRMGGAGSEQANDVEVSPNGDVYVGGQFGGDVNFGGGTRTMQGFRDAFVLKLDSGGNYVWDRPWGGTDFESVDELAFGNGNLGVVGKFQSTSVDFGKGALTRGPSADVFLLKLDESGTTQLSAQISQSATNSINVMGLALDATGNMFFAAEMKGDVDFGGGTLTSPGAGTTSGVALVKLGPTGSLQWVHYSRGADTDYAFPSRVAISTAGDVVFGGQYEGSLDFGLGALTTTNVSAIDAFVIAFPP